MNGNHRAAFAVLAFLLSAAPCSAQVEKLPQEANRNYMAELPRILKDGNTDPRIKSHLGRIRNVNAVRTALAAEGKSLTGPFVYFNVNPMSDAQYLPTLFPYDGTAQGTARIISAKDEYEPCSFVIYPLENLGKVQLRTTEFRNASGKVFPSGELDLKFVKVWYQNRNAWYSYFSDTGLKLVPELLVNDEEIIHADTAKGGNFARSFLPDGSVAYEWVSIPHQTDRRFADHHRTGTMYRNMSPKFRDAKTLQPVAMPEGEYKQFFLTAHVTKDTPEGLYKGAVELVKAGGGVIGSIPVTIRVLPFILPGPKAYLNPDLDFLVTSYSYTGLPDFAEFNGGDFKLAEEQYLSCMRNKVRHNETMMRINDRAGGYYFFREIELSRKAGMRTDYVVGGAIYDNWQNDIYTLRKNAKKTFEVYRKGIPEKGAVFYLAHGDEAPAAWFSQNRRFFEEYQKYGMKFYIAGNFQTFYTAGYFWDWFNMSRKPEESDDIRMWDQVGRARTAWYAQQHVGVENPAHTRRQYGLAAWLAGYTALSNYAHHLGPLNDLGTLYKPMIFFYGTYDGQLDTLSWEGFREGIDDIRYGTLMKRLAKEAQASADLQAQYAGGQALQFLAEIDKKSTNSGYARMEMIRHILKLRAVLNVK